MTFKPFRWVFPALFFTLTGLAWAQQTRDDVEWKEADVPPPPAFDVGKLITIDVLANASLVYGVDPASITISDSDSVVRYVMVATSASGVRNVMYEGIRCATGEFKTYARYSADGRWRAAPHAQWRSLFDNMPSRHALRFAQAGACDSAAPPSTVEILVARLKAPDPNFTK